MANKTRTTKANETKPEAGADASSNGSKVTKNPCPLTLAEFLEKAKSLKITIGEDTVRAEVKEFSTGSFGWYLNAKLPVDVGGTEVSVQLGFNLTVVNSKEAARK